MTQTLGGEIQSYINGDCNAMTNSAVAAVISVLTKLGPVTRRRNCSLCDKPL